jgi:hypothetical protein
VECEESATAAVSGFSASDVAVEVEVSFALPDVDALDQDAVAVP